MRLNAVVIVQVDPKRDHGGNVRERTEQALNIGIESRRCVSVLVARADNGQETIGVLGIEARGLEVADCVDPNANQWLSLAPIILDINGLLVKFGEYRRQNRNDHVVAVWWQRDKIEILNAVFRRGEIVMLHQSWVAPSGANDPAAGANNQL